MICNVMIKDIINSRSIIMNIINEKVKQVFIMIFYLLHYMLTQNKILDGFDFTVRF